MIRLFRVSIPVSVLSLVVCDTLLLFGLYILGTFIGFTDDPEFYLLEEDGLLRIALVVAIIQIGLYFQDLYEEILPRTRILLVQQMCVVLGGVFLIQAVLGYGRWTIQLHKWAMVDGSLLTLIVFPLWRIAFNLVVHRALPAEKILFLGSSAITKQIGERLIQRPQLGLAVVGYIDDEDEVPDGPLPGPRLGCMAD